MVCTIWISLDQMLLIRKQKYVTQNGTRNRTVAWKSQNRKRKTEMCCSCRKTGRAVSSQTQTDHVGSAGQKHFRSLLYLILTESEKVERGNILSICSICPWLSLQVRNFLAGLIVNQMGLGGCPVEGRWSCPVDSGVMTVGLQHFPPLVFRVCAWHERCAESLMALLDSPCLLNQQPDPVSSFKTTLQNLRLPLSVAQMSVCFYI